MLKLFRNGAVGFIDWLDLELRFVFLNRFGDVFLLISLRRLRVSLAEVDVGLDACNVITDNDASKNPVARAGFAFVKP